MVYEYFGGFFVDRKPWVPRCSASLRCLITVRLGITTTTHAAITPRTRYTHVEIITSTYTCRSLSESSSQLKFSTCPPPLPPKHSTPPHYCITHFICNSAVKIDLVIACNHMQFVCCNVTYILRLQEQ